MIEQQILDSLKEGGRILIASHMNPDGDSIGSQLAIYDLCLQLGAEPVIVSHDPIDERYRFLNKFDMIRKYDPTQEYGKFSQAIILEGTEISRIGEVAKILSDDCKIINIDHHSGNKHYGKINWVEEERAAVGIMIRALFKRARVELSADNLMELYLAIMTDTGRFTFSNTDAEVLELAAELVGKGAHPKRISDAIYSSYSEAQVRLLGELISGMELHHEGRTCLLICDRKLLNKYGNEAAEMEGLVNYSLFTRGVQVGVLLREFEKDSIKVSLRSQSAFDVAALARHFSGGGHPTASGCNVDKPLAEARRTLLQLIEEGLAA